MHLADEANTWINDQAPWVLAKQEGQEELVQAICTTGINMFHKLMVYLAPVLPEIARKTQEFLNLEDLNWASSQTILANQPINKFKPLIQRIDTQQIEDLITASRTDAENEMALKSKQ